MVTKGLSSPRTNGLTPNYVLKTSNRFNDRRAVQLGAEADFGPPSDTLAFTFHAWAEAA